MPSESHFPEIEFPAETEDQRLKRITMTIMERIFNDEAVPGDQERLEAVLRDRAALIKRDGVKRRRRR